MNEHVDHVRSVVLDGGFDRVRARARDAVADDERDVHVNNAGASFMASFEDISANGWETIVDINLHGTFHCTQVAGERLREDDGGIVINVACLAGQQGSPHMSHYGAAKAGVINLSSTLAFEWADDVWVNCIAPLPPTSSPRPASIARWVSAPTTSTGKP